MARVHRREAAVFVQVMEGRVRDRDGLRRQLEQWMQELRPGASGFLGTTAGVTDDGRGIVLARFESADAARANSERPDQGAWWSRTEQCFDGPVSFADSEDVDTLLGGGSDEAGFVQVMRDSGVDRARLRALDDVLERHAASFRPDLLGALRVWTGPDAYVEAAYFTSEDAAREGEQREAPTELAEHMADLESLMADVEYLDLRDPWLH